MRRSGLKWVMVWTMVGLGVSVTVAARERGAGMGRAGLHGAVLPPAVRSGWEAPDAGETAVLEAGRAALPVEIFQLAHPRDELVGMPELLPLSPPPVEKQLLPGGE